MECEIKWLANDDTVSFVAKTGSGHIMELDTVKDGSEVSRGPRPMETVLVGAVACTQYDLITGIKEAGGVLHACNAFASGTRREQKPKIFTDIKVLFSIKSENISYHSIQKILDSSKKENGSAMKMLEKSANLTFDIELLPVER